MQRERGQHTLEAGDPGTYDEVFLSCWPCSVFSLSHPYLLDMRTLDTEANVDLVCRHHAGYWNAVSADQFGEQTAIKMGKGGLRGVTLSPELVSEWIDAFPITVHVSNNVDYVYSTSTPGQFKQKQHKEEQKHQSLVDAQD